MTHTLARENMQHQDRVAFYLKVNRLTDKFMICFQKWLDVAISINATYYILCDNPEIENLLKNKFKFINPSRFIKSNRELLSEQVKSLVQTKWYNAAYAHLTTFLHAKENNIKSFWNIDADDISILLPTNKVAEIMKNVQDYALLDNADCFSYDIWRSRESGRHWSFGICFIKNNIDYISIFNKFCKDKDFKAKNFDFNLDWFFTYLDETKKIKCKTFYYENIYVKHFSDFILNHVDNKVNIISYLGNDNINYFKTINVAEDCIAFNADLDVGESLTLALFQEEK